MLKVYKFMLKCYKNAVFGQKGSRLKLLLMLAIHNQLISYFQSITFL